MLPYYGLWCNNMLWSFTPRFTFKGLRFTNLKVCTCENLNCNISNYTLQSWALRIQILQSHLCTEYYFAHYAHANPGWPVNICSTGQWASCNFLMTVPAWCMSCSHFPFLNVHWEHLRSAHKNVILRHKNWDCCA